MKILMRAAILSAAVLSGGCWMMQEPASRQTELYDLNIPASPVRGPEVRRIVNLSPSGVKMLCREQDGRITENRNVCWVQTPEAMLRRYFACAFRNSAGGHVELTLLRFELDRKANQAVIALEARFSGRAAVQYLEAKAPLQNAGGIAAADAMSKCAAELVSRISAITQEK